VERQEITPSLKLRRKVIAEHFNYDIEKLFEE